MNVNKKLNKLIKNNFNHYTFLNIKDNIELLSKYIYEDNNIFYNYLYNTIKNNYKKTYLPNVLDLFKNNICILNTNKDFSFTKIFKIYFEFINHEQYDNINDYFEKINIIMSNNKDFNNFLLENIDVIYPYISNYINLIDFIDNIKYKLNDNHDLFLVYKQYKLDKDKTQLLEKTFPILYPQYKEDFLKSQLTINELLNFQNFYNLLKYIPKKTRNLLYEDNFLKNNYYNLLILNETFILILNKYVNINSLQKEHLNFLKIKEFGIFIEKIENIIFLYSIKLSRQLSFKELVMLFDFSVQEKQNIEFLFVYYLKSISTYKEQEALKNIQQIKKCLIDTLSYIEIDILTNELVENSLENRKQNENPLSLSRDISYFIYFYIICYKKHQFKSSYVKLLKNFENNNKLNEINILLLYFNIKNDTKYKELIDVKEVKFFINELGVSKKYILENQLIILENLINEKYIKLVKICQGYQIKTNLDKKERLYKLANHIVLNKDLDIKKEIFSLSKTLNYPLSVQNLNTWYDKIETKNGKYVFKEVIDINEKWDIGLSPVRTCIAWDKGVFKDTLPSVFASYMKVLKIYENNQCIGRTIISLNVNDKNELSLLIHKIYSKNTALEIQKEIGFILFESLKPFANKLGADLLLFIGRKKTKTGLYVEENEIDIEFKEYNIIVTSNVFNFFFDPLAIEYTSDMKRKPITLLLDDIWYYNNRS